ncbi:hypothetical protein QAD02_005033 [Eretmocerus hayati]|uniref:Uncharacterized protein n=1 Tax=Eretmocerus hayati TaxID=131215 RepID=A0ACC2NSC3_9HYME|nr:hypothetical protein QAD02_005033 [Eretmocerus hayati]
MKFTLFLYRDAGVSRKFIDILIRSFNNLISYLFIPYIKEQIKKELKNDVDANTMGKILFILDQNKSPFSSLLTEKQRFRMYEEKNVYQVPEDYKIGEKKIQISDTETINKPVTGVHLSLSRTSEIFLKIPGILNGMLQYMSELMSEEGTISNIIQGKLWKTKYLPFFKDRIVIPLIVFFDDFETRNPLGSHSGEQKFRGVYISLPCLPPHSSSKLTNILISSIFHAKDRDAYGNHACFAPLLEDLKYLSETGITVLMDGKPTQIYFECVLFVGDNLGVNSCCGSIPGFLSDYCCRICRATAEQCRKLVRESSTLLRNATNYASDLAKGAGGVVQECIFNTMPRFHIAENRALDLMHDLFEGVAPSVIGQVLTILIFKKKYFTLDTLNHRIDKFDYGPHESNKPRPISVQNCTPAEFAMTGLSQRIKIRQSAAEMLVLSKYFVLIIGDLIKNRNDEHWHLYRILRKIIGVVIAPQFNETDVLILRDNIANHHKLYIRLFGSLKPKFHFMTHIPEIMLENGPLIHFWGMTFERKHTDLKDVVEGTTSSRNLLKTIATRNLLKLCYMKEFTDSPENDISIGSIAENMICPSELKKRVPGYAGDHWGKRYHSIDVLGKKFTDGTVFLLRADDYGFPVFARLKEIYEVNSNIYFFASTLDVIDFDDWYHSYRVVDNDEPNEFVNLKLVPKLGPCLVTKIEDEVFVMTRYDT